nr:GNAT family N-acetyltransferase [Crossiella equi]
MLRPLDHAADATTLHQVYSDPEVMAFWHHPVALEVPETCKRLVESGWAHAWAVRESETGPALGLVGILGGVAVPGLSWILDRRYWGRGYAGEAAGAVVAHALGALGLPRVEAWVDVANTRSAGVARRAGLTERGRFAQRYPHREHPHETVVFGRSAAPEQSPVLGVVSTLSVRSVEKTISLLNALVGGQVVYEEPEFAVYGLTPWSGGPQVYLSGTPRPVPTALSLSVLDGLAAAHARAHALGLAVGPVEAQPWGRREFTLVTSDGHEVTVTGPL